MSDENETFGIVPHFFYRKHDAETRKIIGLRATQIEEIIKSGDIDPPANISATGRGVGWQGSQLIKYVRKRQERAVEEQARKSAAAAEEQARKIAAAAAAPAPAPSKKKRRHQR
jgi:hypothetical protein